MKSDTRNASAVQQPTPAKGARPQANAANTAKRGERDSLATERAEGEGMVAPSPGGSTPGARTKPQGTSPVEGEGSYTATHRYNEGLAASIADGEADRLAKEAMAALDSAEGADLRKAEQAAKHGHAR